MPSTITHTYISIDTINKLYNKPKNILVNHLENFKNYSQGMDVLYFYHIYLLKSNYVQELGHHFHTYKPLDIFTYLINKNKQNKNDELFTFICGLISHYHADSTIHPYINYYTRNDKKREKQNKHFVIETFLDCYIINKYTEQGCITYPNYKLLFNTNEEAIITNTLNELFSTFFNYNNMGKLYYQSLKDMKFIFKYFRFDPKGIKKRLYQLIDYNPFNFRRVRYLSYNINDSEINKLNIYLNNDHNTWYNPNNRKLTSKQNFDDLYTITVNKNVKVINQIYEYVYENKDINIKSLIKNNSYSTGLPIK